MIPINFSSRDILRERLKSYFDGLGLPYCYVDPYNESFLREMNLYDPRSHRAEPLSLVLVGGVLATLLESGSWPKGDYRLWVLSTKHKELLKRFFGIAGDQIGVVPRYALAGPASKPRAFDPKGDFTLVYGGRLLRAKGIFHLVTFAHELQTTHGLPVKLALYGDFAEAEPINFNVRPMPEDEFRRELENLIGSLQWRYHPEIVHGLSANEWLKHAKRANPVFASFSHLSHEDYGVSLAQAQSLGWPAILSSWGAHHDAVLENTWLCPRFDPFSSERARRRECADLARAFIGFLRDFLASPTRPTRVESPQTIARPIHTGVLQRKIRRLNQEAPGVVEYASRGLHGFIRTPAGRRLFENYNEVMRGP